MPSKHYVNSGSHTRLVLSPHTVRPTGWLNTHLRPHSRAIEVIIAGAGGAAHLPGMVAGHTLLPVIGVPIQSRALNGLDSLLSIVQMPAGVPVATMAIGRAGAINGALMAVAILANSRPDLRQALQQFRLDRAQQVLEDELDLDD